MFFKRKYIRKHQSNRFNLIKLLPLSSVLLLLFLFGFSNSYHKSWTFDWSGIRQEVKDTILKIKEFDSYSFGLRGLGRIEEYQINRQKWIKKNAFNSELLQLIDYPNGVVKVVSYETLLKRDKKLKYFLLKKSLNDTLTFIHYQMGCFGRAYTLSEFLTNFTYVNYKNDYTHLKEDLTEVEFKVLQTLFLKRKSKENYYRDLYKKSLN